MVRKPAKRPSSNLGVLWVRLPPMPSESITLCPVRLSVRTPGSQPGKAGSTPARGVPLDAMDFGRVAEQVDARASEARALRAWEFDSPLGHSIGGMSKRSSRGPTARCPAHIRATMVRLHPGRLGFLPHSIFGLLVQWEDAGFARRQSGFDSPAVHSVSSVSVVDGLMVQREDTALAWRRSGFDSRSVHCGCGSLRIRKGHPIGDGTRLESERASRPCGFDSRPFRSACLRSTVPMVYRQHTRL